MRSPINPCAVTQVEQNCLSAHPDTTAPQGTPVDEPISYDAFDAFIIVVQPRGLRNRYAARYSRESLLSKHEEAGALRVNVNRQGEARSTSGKNGAAEVHAAINPVRPSCFWPEGERTRPIFSIRENLKRERERKKRNAKNNKRSKSKMMMKEDVLSVQLTFKFPLEKN